MASTKKTYGEKLKHPKWQMRRLEILKRDNATCVLCGDTETELQVHHKEYFGNPWEAKDESLITLCKHCHCAIEELKRIFNRIGQTFILPDSIIKFLPDVLGANLFYKDEFGNLIAIRIVHDEAEIVMILKKSNVDILKDYLNG